MIDDDTDDLDIDTLGMPVHTTATPHGRTGYDFLSGLFKSNVVLILFCTVVLSIVLFFFWDMITSIPIYVVSSIVLAWFWYAPMCRWFSKDCRYVDVFCPKTGLFTTWIVGRSAFERLTKIGLSNHLMSEAGSSRIFASRFEPDELIEHGWVHEHTPMDYHADMRTLKRLTSLVNEVYDDVMDGEALAEVEGRKRAAKAMRRHYADLDALFFGNTISEEESKKEVISDAE